MNKGIHLRLSDELEDFIIRTADDNGLNKSAFTRAILIKAIKEYYPSYPTYSSVKGWFCGYF